MGAFAPARPRPPAAPGQGGFRPGTGSSYPSTQMHVFGGGPAGPVDPGGFTPVQQAPAMIGAFGDSAPPAGGANLTSAANPYLQAFGETATSKMNEVDPFLQEAIQNYRTRMSEDTTKRTTQQAAGAIDDQTAATEQAIKERAAMGGTVGSGQQAGQVASAVESGNRNKALATANIQNAQQSRLDNLTAGAAGALAQPGARQVQWGGLASGNAQATAGNQISAQQLQLQAQQAAAEAQRAQLNAMTNLWNMGGMPGGMGASPVLPPMGQQTWQSSVFGSR